MYGNDQVPVLVLHVLEADISEDASIVDEDIDAAERLDGGVDDLLTFCNAVIVGNSFAASSFNLFNNQICGLDACVSIHLGSSSSAEESLGLNGT